MKPIFLFLVLCVGLHAVPQFKHVRKIRDNEIKTGIWKLTVDGLPEKFERTLDITPAPLCSAFVSFSDHGEFPTWVPSAEEGFESAFAFGADVLEVDLTPQSEGEWDGTATLDKGFYKAKMVYVSKGKIQTKNYSVYVNAPPVKYEGNWYYQDPAYQGSGHQFMKENQKPGYCYQKSASDFWQGEKGELAEVFKGFVKDRYKGLIVLIESLNFQSMGPKELSFMSSDGKYSLDFVEK